MAALGSALRSPFGLVRGGILAASVLACTSPAPHSEVTRHGDDVLVSGSSLQVADSVPGDAILTGGELRFSGATAGDYLGAGGDQVIGGRVHGSVRAAGGEIRVAAVVDRNATVAGGNVAVDRAAVIGRNAYFAGGTVGIDGTVAGAMLVSGGTVTLDGTVGRDVEVFAGGLRVGPHARIAGNLRYRVPEGKVRIDSAARISGPITALQIPRAGGAWYVLGILWTLGFLVAGGVVVALIPGVVAGAAEVVRARPGRSALIGLGWVVAAPVAIILAAVTVIGIPLALLTAAVYAALAYLGRIAPAVWLGRRVLGARARTGRRGVLVNFLVGGVILLLVGVVPVLGSLVIVVTTILGIGALLIALRRSQDARPV